MKEKIKKALIELSEICEDCQIHESCIEKKCAIFRIEKLLNEEKK